MDQFYIEKGQGFPLLLLHGNGESSAYFTRQIDCFASDFHVYALDTRGHGQTPRGEGPFTIRRFAEDLLVFMNAHGIAKAHILGFSDGGNIAMIFALRHPELVEKLVLNGANLNPKGVKGSVQLPIELGYRLTKRFAGRDSKARANAEMLGLMVNDPNVSPEELTQIQSPTLVIAGTRDMIRRKHTEEIAAAIPGAELVFVKGDHFIARKNPEAFNASVRRFLQR